MVRFITFEGTTQVHVEPYDLGYISIEGKLVVQPGGLRGALPISNADLRAIIRKGKEVRRYHSASLIPICPECKGTPLFPQRSTFIIGREGIILYANPSVDPKTHSQEIRDILSKLPV